jgi:hypothetical protein
MTTVEFAEDAINAQKSYEIGDCVSIDCDEKEEERDY